MAEISRKKSIIKKRMTEFHAKPRKKTVFEKTKEVAKKVYGRATSEEAKEGRKRMVGAAVSFGKGILDIGRQIAENRARMERESRRTPRKKKSKRR